MPETMFTHFLTAQDPIYETVLDELHAGDKQSHWMWFIFPQLRGLGLSPTAQKFGIEDLDEAEAYLAHEILGARLRECTEIVLALRGRTAREIFGSPDDLKFRSSMTLFAAAAAADKSLQWSDLSREGHETYGRVAEAAASAGGDHHIFTDALAKYYEGERDPLTLDLLGL